MGIREDVLALADELDGVSLKDDCESCLASGTSLCRGDLECAESAHKACAKRLREIVEHDAGEVTTVSAYDPLPEDEREAIAWVREQGGLDLVKASIHQGAMGHGCLLKIAEMLGTSIYDGTDNADALLAKISERLMPEGMEWPRFEEGEMLQWNDEYANGNGGVSPLHRVSLYADGRAMLGKGKVKVVLAPGERAKRPPVLAADGEPIEVGQTVYATHYGYVKCTVLAIEWVVDGYLVEVENEGGHKFRQTPDEFTHQRPVLDADGVEISAGDVLYSVETDGSVTVDGIEPGNPWFATTDGALQHCAKFTHRAPVIAADGKPLKEGETVWDVESGIEYEVVGIHTDEDNPVRVMRTDGSHLAKAAKPSTLSHQRPVLDADGVPIKVGDTVYEVGENCPPFIVGRLPEPDAYRSVRVVYPSGAFMSLDPERLTHSKPEPPDSWERLNEDAKKNPFDYCKDVGHRLDTCENAERYKARDLVRRCCALAERGA